MISNIYKSNYAIWEAGSLKGKSKSDINKEFKIKLEAKPKYKKTVSNDIKRRNKLAARFKELNPHLFK